MARSMSGRPASEIDIGADPESAWRKKVDDADRPEQRRDDRHAADHVLVGGVAQEGVDAEALVHGRERQREVEQAVAPLPRVGAC